MRWASGVASHGSLLRRVGQYSRSIGQCTLWLGKPEQPYVKGLDKLAAVKRSRAEMTSMIFTPRHNDWNRALWISAHYVCILLLIRYHCFNDFVSATPLKPVIYALHMWAAIMLSMCRRYPTFIC